MDARLDRIRAPVCFSLRLPSASRRAGGSRDRCYPLRLEPHQDAIQIEEMNRRLTQLAKSVLTPLAQKAAKSYIAGPELKDALRVCRRLSDTGVATTVCYWNDEGAPPREVADAYIKAADALAPDNLNCYLSVKAPPLGYSSDLLAEIVDHSRRRDILVHFDSLAPETADSTFALIEKMLPRSEHLGCTLPARWARSPKDAEWAAARQLHVRIVKGQWEDPTELSRDPREGFLEVIDRLAGRARQVGVATHDSELAREALTRLIKSETPCELELLFGLPVRPLEPVVRDLKVPVRFYVPYGHAWLPYAMSQIRKNPRILWWMARGAFSSRTLTSINGSRSAAVAADPASRV